MILENVAYGKFIQTPKIQRKTGIVEEWKKWNDARLTARLDEPFGQGRAGNSGMMEDFFKNNYFPLSDANHNSFKEK